uniref:Myosin light chain kinase, smooth muscle-like n=1 Tax=Haplochromis burtoni TaxID=8153 RepID=A0A3Q2W0H4_HAPBU
KMDQDGKAPKTFVSTLRFALKPQPKHQKENGLGNIKRNLEAPRFEEPLRDCTVCAGSDAAFKGVITGSQPMSISWLYNGEKLRSSNISFENGAACLSLTRCSPKNAGRYTCIAENPAGQQSSAALLHVKGNIKSRKHTCESNLLPQSPQILEKPVFKTRYQPVKLCFSSGPPVEFVDPPEQVEVRVAEQALLRCEFKSSSLPVASCWIYNRDKVRMLDWTTPNHSSVQIFHADPKDAGSYTVIVRNRAGSAQHTISLSVVDRPNPPASQPVVSQLSTQSLVLSWSGPNYDGGTTILGYILEPLGRYRFRIRAYNSAGISEPSQESGCVKMATASDSILVVPVSYVIVTPDTQNKVRDHYNVHEKLGVGKFGEVYRITQKETGQECAGKFYRARTMKERKAARKEIELMNKLHHPKLVQCLAAYDSRSEMVMVMEYIAGGELFERIVDENFEHTEPTSARYMQQILEGMQYVHKQNIIHLDLKPENIVCVDTTGTRIKIIDFGLATELEEGKSLMVMHGTPEFVAPEVIGYEPVGLETDMWSIGVICFILLSGESPFQGNSDAETLALVTAASYEFDPESFEDISDQAKDFISSLLQKDRRRRLSCTEALAHSWMASFTPLNRRPTKSLNKEKMRHFLAKRKWKKTGKAVLALKRMANLTSKPSWSQEAEEAIRSLDNQLQIEPHFQQALKDVTLPVGAAAQLTCVINGYPQPEVKWLHNEKPVPESRGATIEHHGEGLCSLVLADLKFSDSGVYVCKARNKLGEAMCSAKLKVRP